MQAASGGATNPTILLNKEPNVDLQETSLFASENNFAPVGKVAGGEHQKVSSEISGEQTSKKSTRGGKVPLFQNIDAKYDLFGMKIKSYTYEPSSS